MSINLPSHKSKAWERASELSFNIINDLGFVHKSDDLATCKQKRFQVIDDKQSVHKTCIQVIQQN